MVRSDGRFGMRVPGKLAQIFDELVENRITTRTQLITDLLLAAHRKDFPHLYAAPKESIKDATRRRNAQAKPFLKTGEEQRYMHRTLPDHKGWWLHVGLDGQLAWGRRMFSMLEVTEDNEVQTTHWDYLQWDKAHGGSPPASARAIPVAHAGNGLEPIQVDDDALFDARKQARFPDAYDIVDDYA